jgi:hypothetical protein
MLHDWRQIIFDEEKESAKVEMDNKKLQKESAKVEMDRNKLDKESAKVQIDSVKLEEELVHVANFSDLETDDEAWWLQDSVDLRGYSQVEDDEFNEQVM